MCLVEAPDAELTCGVRLLKTREESAAVVRHKSSSSQVGAFCSVTRPSLKRNHRTIPIAIVISMVIGTNTIILIIVVAITKIAIVIFFVVTVAIIVVAQVGSSALSRRAV